MVHKGDRREERTRNFDADGKYHGVKLHDARRAAGTELIDAGNDSHAVMQLLGHKTDSMLRRYRIIKSETSVRAVRRREAYIEQQRTADSNGVSLDDRRNSRGPTEDG